jgi:hypothetical protein
MKGSMTALAFLVAVGGAIGCGGPADEDGVAGVEGQLGTEPAIPSCSECELRMQVFGGARARGSFSPVNTSIFRETRILLNAGTSNVGVPLPTGGAYDQPVAVSSKPNTAEMQFRYVTAIGELRWTSTTIVMPVKSPFAP